MAERAVGGVALVNGLRSLVARERLPAALTLAVFAALVIASGVHHEPWFDEAQAWLIARDNNPWTLLTSGVRYEGTPALWHLILWVVQRLGLPYGELWLVSGALAVGGAALVVYKSPFPLWMRIGLIFSYFFAFQYAVVARSYALDLVLLPALAALFEQRTARPLLYAGLLALLANTNAHSFVLSSVLALELLWTLRERVLARDALALLAIGLYGSAALAAIAQAWPPQDINFLTKKVGDNPALRGAVILTEAFIERGDIFALTPPSLPWRAVGLLLTVAVLAPAAWLCRSARRLPLALGLFGVLVGFSAVKYGNNWHAGIVFLTFVFCLWINWAERDALPVGGRRWLVVAIAALLAVQVFDTGAAEVRGWLSPYSAAPAAARALLAHRQAHPGETLGVVGFKGFGVAPYFRANPFANYEGGAEKPSYYLWRRDEAPIPGVSEPQWSRVIGGGYDRLLLSSFNLMGWNGPARYIADANAAGYCPTALFRGAMIWKTYVLETDDMMIFDRCQWISARRHHP
jgi:hypothetical protein